MKLYKYLPRLQDIFFISIFIAVLLLGNRMINLDGDLPRHLLSGRYILETLRVPNTEKFIYPYENQPYVYHEWIAQVIFQVIYKWMGLPGLVLLAAILLSITFYTSYVYLSKKTSLRLPVLFIVAWGALVTSLNWAIRPHLFSMCLLAIWLIWADRLRRGEDISLWRFPVLMVIWSNIHGEFIAGVLVLLAFAVGWIVDSLPDRKSIDLSAGKRLWLALVFSSIASLANPGGAGSWKSILGFVNNQYLMSHMVEANVPNFQAPETRILLLFLAFSILILALKREKLSIGQGILLAGFTAMSLISFRNIHLYGVVAPFVLAESLTSVSGINILDLLDNTLGSIERQIFGSFWIPTASLILGGLVLLSPVSFALYTFEPETFPVQAVEWLKKNPIEGRMYNDLNWGGYIELNLWPQQKTFIDSIADVTGEATKKYETILTTANGWENLMDSYNITWAIIESDSPLANILVNEKHWGVLYQDDTAIILQK